MKTTIVARCPRCQEDAFKDILDYADASCWNCNAKIDWTLFKRVEIADITRETIGPITSKEASGALDGGGPA